MKNIVRASTQMFMAGMLGTAAILLAISWLGKVYRESNPHHRVYNYEHGRQYERNNYSYSYADNSGM